MKFLSVLILLIFVSISHADPMDAGCFFSRDGEAQPPSSLKSLRVAEFLIYANDLTLVSRHREIIERSTHFLQTELGWKFPFTRKELSRPVLEVYFIQARAGFTGTVQRGPVIVLNENVLKSEDFAAYWIHQLAHASELMYRKVPANGIPDLWFYEATAGWMEGQFGQASKATRLAQQARRLRPQMPLEDASPDLALGASMFLDVVSRPYRDVLRQIWEQWAYARDERVLDILARVLQLNHLPSRDSYLLNYFLRAPIGRLLDNNTTDIVVQPFAAVVLQGSPEGALTGGAHISFEPKDPTGTYSASLIYYATGEREGILTIKESLRDPWSATLPFSGMARYRMLIVNGTNQILRGSIVKRMDGTIPAVIEYFHANAEEEGGVQLEWKTARENGVAFWNVYRVENGARQRLNALPIPASIDEPTGLHYLFIDHVTGAFYSLEAITQEGFPSAMATAATGSGKKEPTDDR